jgi:hypothetical protein
MPTTFKTDKATGKTVISSDNQVQSAAQGGDNQFEYRQDAANLGLRPGRERMLNVISSQQPVQPGYMNFNEFRAVRGMTKTNPYGNDGFFSRVLGIDPSKIDYTSNLGPQGIENVSRIAYDRFLNPFAKVSSVTGRPVGGDAATGTPRYGISPGEQTIAGIAREVPRTGLDALVSGIPFVGGIARMFGDRPTRITPMEDYEQQQQALGMGANLYGKPGSSISSMIEGAKQFFQAGQDQTAPMTNTRVAPIQNVEPVGPTSDFNEILRQQELQGPPELTQDVTQGFNQINVDTALDFPGDINDYNSRLRQSTIGTRSKTAEQLQEEAIARGFDAYNYMER